MRYKNWKTKDGKKIPINKLGDEHLTNILRLLIRTACVNKVKQELAFLCPAIQLHGEMAQDAFDQEFDAVMELDVHDYLPPIYEDLEQEAIKRKLALPDIPASEVVDGITLTLALKQRSKHTLP